MPSKIHTRRSGRTDSALSARGLWETSWRAILKVSGFSSASKSGRGQSKRRSRSRLPSLPFKREQLKAPAESTYLVRAEPPVSTIRIAAFAVLGLLVAGGIVSTSEIESLAPSNPDRVLRFFGNTSKAFDALAERELADPDGSMDSAKEWLQSALRASPLDQTALFLLSQVAERQGRVSDEQKLLRLAAQRGWGYAPAQAMLLKNEISKREYGPALLHADALLRSAPDDYQNRLLPVLVSYFLDAEASNQLFEFLGRESPPWRRWFLEQISARLIDKRLVDSAFGALAGAPNPPSEDERRAYVARLIKDGRYLEAEQQWLQGLEPGAKPDGRYPYNRDFKLEFDGSPFNWIILAEHGAEIDTESVDGGRRRLLRAQFSGARVNAEMKQLMLLPPGRYAFKGEVKAEALRAARGLWWRLSCAGKESADLGHTDLWTTGMPWTNFSIQFEIPETQCAAQWIRMEIPARVASEAEIEGKVWFRYLRIEPRPAASTSIN